MSSSKAKRAEEMQQRLKQRLAQKGLVPGGDVRTKSLHRPAGVVVRTWVC